MKRLLEEPHVVGEHVGQRDFAVTANAYSHVLADETELGYVLLRG